MKKSLNVGKIWTVLALIASAVLVTCGVWAQSNGLFKSSLKSDKLQNSSTTNAKILTAGDWDQLMDMLDQLNFGGGDSVPAGAVMAFAHTTKCPEGWSVYTPAINRYIRGGSASYYDNTEEIQDGGTLRTGDPLKYPDTVVRMESDRRWLKVENLPPHSHSIFVGWRGNEGGNDTEQSVSIGFSKPGNRGIDKTTIGATMDNYYGVEYDCRPGDSNCKNWQGYNNNNTVETDKMYGSAFNIMDPYVYLLYCIKDGDPWDDTPDYVEPTCDAKAPNGHVGKIDGVCPTWATMTSAGPLYNSDGTKWNYGSFAGVGNFNALTNGFQGDITSIAFVTGNSDCKDTLYASYGDMWYKVNLNCNNPYKGGTQTGGYYLNSVSAYTLNYDN